MAQKGISVKGNNQTIRIEKADNGYVVSSFKDYPGDGKERKRIAKDIKEVRSITTEFLK